MEWIQNSIYLEKYIDIAIIVDDSERMQINREEIIKFILRLANNLINDMKEKNRFLIKELRIKIILFRDFAIDGEMAFADSGFFSIPYDKNILEEYVSKISMYGGGKYANCALEALALAMKSDWTTNGDSRRHIIFLMTNSSAWPLGDVCQTKSPYYPSNMPQNIDELNAMWDGTSENIQGMPLDRGERLVLVVPNIHPWIDLQIWNNVWPCFLKYDKEILLDSLYDLFFHC